MDTITNFNIIGNFKRIPHTNNHYILFFWGLLITTFFFFFWVNNHYILQIFLSFIILPSNGLHDLAPGSLDIGLPNANLKKKSTS